MGQQEDGFSCGMLVDNAHQHFVDPSIPLTKPREFVNSRLEVFNKACTRSLEQVFRFIFVLFRLAERFVPAGDRASIGASRR
jgi:hypothetical protein